MNKREVTKQVELYLKTRDKESLLVAVNETCNNTYDAFLQNTILRLVSAFELYCKTQKYLADFLLSLRDFLLVFEEPVFWDSEVEEKNLKEYGIQIDLVTGKLFAGFQFPRYLNDYSSLIEDAFLRDLNKTKDKSDGYNLITDPKIRSLTGYYNFKSLAQKLAVYGALNTQDGYTTLISLPTGGGKSLVTQTITFQREGLTIVIVPTVSLAIDQVRVAKQTIKRATADKEIFYYSSGVDSKPILEAIRNKTARLLFLSPETIMLNKGFKEEIQKANKSLYLKNIVVDEAHIVVDWGAAFRVDYQCIESWRKNLVNTNSTLRTILLSATFEELTVNILKELFSDGQHWTCIRCDALRHEPRFIYVPAKSKQEKNKKILEMIKRLPHPMIIYATRPVEAEDLAKILKDHGIKNVKTFTGLTTARRRTELINAWEKNDFSILVATSAFGIGVDKPDVRTVIHVNMPQNPNAYYQELGRGGRDGLPSLSVMCIVPETDEKETRSMISKRVMTTEKIIGRWDSMYHNPLSIRVENVCFIDTATRPNYAEKDDIMNDTEASDVDINWNVYVLLLLRRYRMIEIVDVVMDGTKYIIGVKVVNDLLQIIDDELKEKIEEIRSIEFDNYWNAFNRITKAVKNNKRICWSEMFFETYVKAGAYCAGCNAHQKLQADDIGDFALKEPVRSPCKRIDLSNLPWVSQSSEMMITCSTDHYRELLDDFILRGFQLIVVANNAAFQDVNLTAQVSHTMIIDQQLFAKLLNQKSAYYLSGNIIVLYNGNEQENTKLYRNCRKLSNTISSGFIAHIAENNFYIRSVDKHIGDLLNGPIINSELIINGGTEDV